MWIHPEVFSFCDFCSLESFSTKALLLTSWSIYIAGPNGTAT